MDINQAMPKSSVNIVLRIPNAYQNTIMRRDYGLIFCDNMYVCCVSFSKESVPEIFSFLGNATGIWEASLIICSMAYFSWERGWLWDCLATMYNLLRVV